MDADSIALLTAAAFAAGVAAGFLYARRLNLIDAVLRELLTRATYPHPPIPSPPESQARPHEAERACHR